MRKKKNLNGLLCFLCAMICSCFLSVSVFAEGSGQVYDDAALLDTEEKNSLQETAAAMAEETGYDFLLLTIDDAEGKTPTEYAEDFYMDHKTTLNGAIYLIDMDNRTLKVATSGDMIYYLTDERIEAMLDDAFEYAGEESYYECMAVFLRDTQEYLDKGIPSDQYTVDADTGEIVRYTPPKKITPLEALIAAVIAVAAGGGVFGGVVGKYRMKWGNYSYSYQENSKLNLKRKQDMLVNKFVTQRRIPKDPPPSSGGGGGSGSTIHTGSGGNSFGGGERHF